jgi:hypothetical protein
MLPQAQYPGGFMKKANCLWTILLAGFFFWCAALPARAEAPNLGLKDSIAVAEKALTDAHVKIENYYLFSITFSHSSKGDFWSYTYRPQTPSEFNQVYVKVYMDKTAEVRGGSENA